MQKAVERPLLVLERATSADQFAAAAELRNEIYRRRLGLDLGSWRSEWERDRAGHVFVLSRSGTPVATGRALPTGSPQCELRELGQLPRQLADDTRACEVSRIVTTRLDEEQRVPYSMVLLCMGARWLLEHTDLRRYVAYCRIPLVRLYQAVGAVDLETCFRIADRGDTVYTVVVGDLASPAELAEKFSGDRAVLAARDSVRAQRPSRAGVS